MPETFASKYRHHQKSFWYKALCLEEFLSTAVCHKIICVNHIQKNKIISRGIPDAQKMIVMLNVPDPKYFGETFSGKDKRTKSRSFKMVYHGTVAASTRC